MDLQDLLSIIWRQRLVVLLVVALSAAGGVALASNRDAEYESTATIAITPDPETFGIVTGDSLDALLGTYAETVESDVVVQAAEADLGDSLNATITGTSEEGTGILQITARSISASQAQRAATAVGTAFLERLSGDDFIIAELVGPPERPAVAVQPRPPLIIGASVVVGLGFAVLIALAFDRMRRRIESPADLAEITTRPLIGQIPRDRRLAGSDPTIVLGGAATGEINEGFRSLRTNLQFIASDGVGAVQFTSASATQGKSTIVANLGVAFAQVGVRTAIIDADVRRPSQHQIFQIPNAPGWPRLAAESGNHKPSRSKAARESEDLAMPAAYAPMENLSVLPAGTPLEDPTPVLHIQLPWLIEQLKSNHSIVLVDSPPLLPVADGMIIASHVDIVVLAVSAGGERAASFREALGLFELSNVSVEGIVLNRYSPPRGSGGYHYYHAARDALAQEAPASGSSPVEVLPRRSARTSRPS